MTIMLLPCFILGLLMSESASQPSLQMCPNCKQVGRQALRYRGMRERFWGRTRVKDGKILEKITAKKEVVEKGKEEVERNKEVVEKGKEGVEEEVPAITNVWKEWWPKPKVSAVR